MNKKPTGIFYLTERGLVIQTEKAVLKEIIFPSEIIVDGEISDIKAFRKYLVNEIGDIAKRVKVGVILIGAGLLYQRSVDDQGDIPKAKEALFSSVPFDRKYISEKIIETPSKTYLLVTHKLFYETLMSACQERAVVIMAVLPLSLFSDEEVVTTIANKIVKVILTKEELYDRGNFISQQEDVSPVKDARETVDQVDKAQPVSGDATYRAVRVWNTTRLVVVLGFLIALTAILGGLIYLQINRYQAPGQPKEVAPVSVITPTPTPTEAPEEVSKGDLAVVIENGTGTAGQAGKVKALVQSLDYINIETGNADSLDYEKTEVIFSGKVSQAQQKELKDLLLKSFTAVVASFDDASKTDVRIITGQEK